MTDIVFIPTKAAAQYLGLSRRTLEKFRVTGGGPVFYALGRRRLYRREDLDAWALARLRKSTSDPGQAA